MARSRAAGTEGHRVRPRGGTYSQRTISLLSRRDAYITQIELLSARQQVLSPFVKKASALLTRHWARADWQAREEILRSVGWLLGVARLEAARPVAKVRKRKRAIRRGGGGRAVA